MKEIKLKWLWAVDDLNGVQWNAFRYKKDAKAFAIRITGVIHRRKCLTDRY